MAKDKEIVTGPVIYAPPTLHGRRVKLIRGGKEVSGVLMAKDSQTTSDKLVFQWTNENGTSSLSPLTGEELEELKNG